MASLLLLRPNARILSASETFSPPEQKQNQILCIFRDVCLHPWCPHQTSLSHSARRSEGTWCHGRGDRSSSVGHRQTGVKIKVWLSLCYLPLQNKIKRRATVCPTHRTVQLICGGGVSRRGLWQVMEGVGSHSNCFLLFCRNQKSSVRRQTKSPAHLTPELRPHTGKLRRPTGVKGHNRIQTATQ